MARTPEDGAEADPEGRRTLSMAPTDDAPNQPAPALGQGEPSSREDPEALRVEALSEEGAGLAPRMPVSEAEGEEPGQPDDLSASTLARDFAEPVSTQTSWESDSTSSTDAFAPGEAGPSQDRTFETTDQHEDPPVSFARDEGAFEASAHGASASESYLTGAAPQPVVSRPGRRGGAGALLLGGVAAAALGFGAAWFARDRWEPAPAGLTAELEERLAALEARPLPDDTEIQSLAERLSEAEARLEALEEAPARAAETPPPARVDLDPLREEVVAGLADAEERAAELEERLAALEARPAEGPRGTPAAGPALRAPDESDAGTEAVAGLEPRLAAIESGTTETTAALSDVRAELESLGARVETSEATLAELEARLGEAPAATETALSELRTAFEELRDSVGANDTALAEIDARLSEAEARLGEAEAAGASAAEEARAAAAALAESRSRADAAEAQARREAALVALDAALDAGEPLGALSDLGTEPPEALARAAEEGIPSLATLREAFPEAARAGLAAARSEGLVEEGGVMGFLRGQLSVRSTAPREGDDPDAVLSRAEAALASGRLDATLAELQTLPEPVQSAMADWTAQARARSEAEAALATLRGAEPGDTPAD